MKWLPYLDTYVSNWPQQLSEAGSKNHRAKDTKAQDANICKGENGNHSLGKEGNVIIRGGEKQLNV